MSRDTKGRLDRLLDRLTWAMLNEVYIAVHRAYQRRSITKR